MNILISKKTIHGEVAVGIKKNKVYTLINNNILTSHDDMSVDALMSEDWVPCAFLNMEIQRLDMLNTIDEEFNKLAKMID